MKLSTVQKAVYPWKVEINACHNIFGKWNGKWEWSAKRPGYRTVHASSGVELINKIWRQNKAEAVREDLLLAQKTQQFALMRYQG